MKRILTILLLILIASLHAPAGTSEEEAQKSADGWLSLLDGKKYAETWDEAAMLFQNAVTKDDWIKMMQGARDPLGAVKSRKLKSATYTKTMPGAPDGEYVVLQYETVFENKTSAAETITPMLEKDRGWRVAGYYIR